MERCDLFERMAETSPDAICVYDLTKERITYVNARAEQVIGYTPAEVTALGGRFPLTFWHPQDLSKLSEYLRRFQTLAEGQIAELEYRVRQHDGTYRWLRSRVSSFWCAEGEVQEIIVVTQNVTELKQTEEALRRAHEEMEQRVASRTEQLSRINAERISEMTERKQAEERLAQAQADLARVSRITTVGELAASIAHEINQPLGAIVNNGNACLRILAGLKIRDYPLLEALSDIVNDADRASAIIARIRAFTRRTPKERMPLRIDTVVQDVLRLAQRELVDRRITVCTEFSKDLPQVSGDPIQLQQVFLNLVMNGIEAMSAVAAPRRILTIRGRPDQLAGRPEVLISVHDFGHGFKQEDSERLFAAFYTTKAEGMGMGLRISRSIVEANGGRLWATVNEGHGATFWCALPVEHRTGS